MLGLQFKKYSFNPVFWFLIFLLLYSNYTPTSFVYDNRVLFSILIVLLALARLILVKTKFTIVDIPTSLVIASFSLLTIFDLIKGLYASSLGSVMFVLIILVTATYNYEKTFQQITLLNKLINIASLIFMIAVIVFFNGRARNIFGIPLPYFISFTSQPSLIPALIMVPYGMYLLFYKKYETLIFTMLTILLCFSGNVYMAIIIAAVLYFIINQLSKRLFIMLPFLLMIILFVFISIVGNTFREKSIEMRLKAKEFTNSRGTIEWKMERLISGTERFAFYYEQIRSTEENLLIGSDSAKDFQSLGSLILKFGIRGGIIVMIMMTAFLGFLLNELYKFKNSFPEKKVGVVLIYSLIIQAMVYNEMGFFSLFTICLLYILYALLKAKNEQATISQ